MTDVKVITKIVLDMHTFLCLMSERLYDDDKNMCERSVHLATLMASIILGELEVEPEDIDDALADKIVSLRESLLKDRLNKDHLTNFSVN